MKVRKVKRDDYGNITWDFGHGLSSYVTGQNAIKQDVLCSLGEWKNDCFWALNNGIDWRLRMGFRNQKEMLDNDIIKVIQSRYGVLYITDFVSYVMDRVYTCQCEIITIFSEGFQFTYSKEV